MIELVDHDELSTDIPEKGVGFVNTFASDIKVVDVAIGLDQLCCQCRLANTRITTDEVVATRMSLGETRDRIEDEAPAYKVMRLLIDKACVVTNLLPED